MEDEWTEEGPEINALDNGRNVRRKLAHGRAAELEHDPAAREMLLLGVGSYPLGEVLVAVCCGGHDA